VNNVTHIVSSLWIEYYVAGVWQMTALPGAYIPKRIALDPALTVKMAVRMEEVDDAGPVEGGEGFFLPLM
jgi:hypothetical protein